MGEGYITSHCHTTICTHYIEGMYCTDYCIVLLITVLFSLYSLMSICDEFSNSLSPSLPLSPFSPSLLSPHLLSSFSPSPSLPLLSPSPSPLSILSLSPLLPLSPPLSLLPLSPFSPSPLLLLSLSSLPLLSLSSLSLLSLPSPPPPHLLCYSSHFFPFNYMAKFLII